ncbi:hypothetical protein DFH28DRAFT_945159 [Melampsora americana]|nr:hypothetical protein DFH28DRAFT_945159 [Melampsora americana]
MMLALRPNYLIVLALALSVIGISSTCVPPKPLALYKETERLVITLIAIHANLATLLDIENDKEAINSVIHVAKDGYCGLVTLNHARNRITKIVGKPLSTVVHKATDKTFKDLDKKFVEFQKKEPSDAVKDAKGFAKGMSKSIHGIKKYTDMLSKAKLKKH